MKITDPIPESLVDQVLRVSVGHDTALKLANEVLGEQNLKTKFVF